MPHVIVIPYYCSMEVQRFQWIARLFEHLPTPSVPVEFLLAASSTYPPSQELYDAFVAIAPTSTMQCGERGDGHHQGSTLMFWQVMEYVRRHFPKDGDFVLWMESDMAPAKSDWLDHLDREWRSIDEPLLMGQLVTQIPEHLGGGFVPTHINGGACYSKQLADYVPPGSGRRAPFDVGLFPCIEPYAGRWRASQQFVFSTAGLSPNHVADDRVSLVHGLAQPKDEFMRHAISAIAPKLMAPPKTRYNGRPNSIKEAMAAGRSFVDIYRQEFKVLLDGQPYRRGASFEKIFGYLESQSLPEYLVVETGCVRQESWIDGRSTVQFDCFVQSRGGRVFSVDHNEAHCDYAKRHTSDLTTVVNEDSVRFLSRFSQRGMGAIDLLYLDSMDITSDNVHSTALHHFKELCAAMSSLRSGSLVVVDDHISKQQPGKSRYVLEFMEQIGAEELFEDYQIGWVLP